MPAISQAFRCFDAVARRGSIRKAAESLNLTAAAVNQQILNLESQVGTPLFDRLPRGVQLTLAGEIMIAAVRRSQLDVDQAMRQVEDLRTLRRGHVNVGTSHSSAEYLVPQVIESILASHPGLTFSVRTGNGASLLDALAQGEVDIAYCLRRSPPAGVEETRAWPQRLGVVTAIGHPLTARPERLLRMRDCLGYPQVAMAPDTELRALADVLEARLPPNRRPLAETSSVALVRQLVASNLAIGFLIPDNVAQDVLAGRLAWRPLADTGARSHTCIYQRSGYATSVASALFIEQLEQAVARIDTVFEPA